MVKYTSTMIKQAMQLFPKDHNLHNLMTRGDKAALDCVELYVGFNIDEDDIIRAFRNKKEEKLLECAKRAKAIRDFYQELFMHIEKYSDKKAFFAGCEDCL